MALERTFDVPIPLHDVQERWRQIQAQRAGGTFPGGTGGTPGPGGGKPGTTP